MVKFRYSSSSERLIKNLKNFKKEEFEEWFEKTYIYGDSDILRYLYEKELKRDDDNELG